MRNIRWNTFPLKYHIRPQTKMHWRHAFALYFWMLPPNAHKQAEAYIKAGYTQLHSDNLPRVAQENIAK